jgi:TATA-box binding protein (TBP) (component of TFIID and TFIIIB)
MNSLDDEWASFLMTGATKVRDDDTVAEDVPKEIVVPECTSISISTKTKIIYLDIGIDILARFWDLPMIDYDCFSEGIIKKQIKLNFMNKADVQVFEENLARCEHPTSVKILNQIDNPNGRVVFKDVRKIDVGLCKGDLLKNNKKKKNKSAFYNCFVMIYRLWVDGAFKEVHVKLFNSGKIEIPGVQSDEHVDMCVDRVKLLLQPYYPEQTIMERRELRETILVNSNFSCGYYVNREALVQILKNKYGINQCNYDPCSYPGVQCKYRLPNGEVSFMIFRTGSVLVVGKCDDDQLYEIYAFLKKIFHDEFTHISELDHDEPKEKKSKKKVKKVIYFNRSARV